LNVVDWQSQPCGVHGKANHLSDLL